MNNHGTTIPPVYVGSINWSNWIHKVLNILYNIDIVIIIIIIISNNIINIYHIY